VVWLRRGVAMLGRRVLWSVVAALVAGSVVAASTVFGASPGSGPTGGSGPSREEVAQILLANHRDRFATPALTRALRVTAGELSSPGRDFQGEDAEATGQSARRGAGPAGQPPRAGLRNVRVNNPAADHRQVDQTTQSETSIAVAGHHVAVGFNDSQQALLALTDGFDSSGYGYSRNGGHTFTDGGTLPNPPGFVNFGDPWLAADRAGRMYYSTLTFGGNVGNLEIGVARSNNGGKTWTTPTFASPNDDTVFYFGDKDAMTVGRDPHAAGRDNLYVVWDDLVIDNNDHAFTGLPVASSTDHGHTWSLHYVDRIPQDQDSCSFEQYIGAQPLVDPGNGTLYVAAEKISVRDPRCVGGAPTFSQVITRSTDAGRTFTRPRTIATIAPASPTGALQLGPGQFVRTAEFPTLALHEGTLWAAWNDGSTGRSHIRLARSTDAGRTWQLSAATRGTGDEIQPALATDTDGLHLAYYQRNPNNTLDTVLADTTDDFAHVTATRITSRSFPGVITVPQFDPQVAFGYMGDYIANVSDGTHLYLAWGDNRDRITNFTHPQGRNDPNIYFTRR
jgi:hypothetical protein